nr:MAG TPA_asm: hypothetical protein [Caudoviricetes sp.]DAP85280.1 MAG TPA: hypothetical protein [Caudoviricetes sp.]DAS69773.1 MAG TPA: hypothetical protein [Caudoviricetes sp.]
MAKTIYSPRPSLLSQRRSIHDIRRRFRIDRQRCFVVT